MWHLDEGPTPLHASGCPSVKWNNKSPNFIMMMVVVSIFPLQGRSSTTKAKKPPGENDFDTIKLISNGAYGWATRGSGGGRAAKAGCLRGDSRSSLSPPAALST